MASLSLMGIVLVSSPMLLVAGGVEPALAQASAPAIPVEEAIQIARFAVPNAVIREVEFELERRLGRWVWEVEFTNNLEVKIDATTGDIIDIDMDD